MVSYGKHKLGGGGRVGLGDGETNKSNHTICMDHYSPCVRQRRDLVHAIPNCILSSCDFVEIISLHCM